MSMVLDGTLAKETTTTTGTGSYTLAGAVADYLTFAAAVNETPAAGLYVPYVCRMGAVFEAGIGELTAASTLVRTTIIENSSGTSSPISWAAGTKEIYIAKPARSETLGRHNLVAGAPPDISTDDASEGYARGSLWLEEAGRRAWMVVHNATLQQDWVLIGSRANLPMRQADDTVITDSLNFGYCADRGTADAYCSVGFGQGGLAEWPVMKVHGHGPFETTDYGRHQTGEVGLILETTNDTPTQMDCSGEGYLDYLTVPINSCVAFVVVVAARNNAGSENKAWEIKAAVKRGASGAPVIVGTATVTEIGEDAGASAWDVDLVIDSGNEAVAIEATGEAATTIRWTASVRATQVSFP